MAGYLDPTSGSNWCGGTLVHCNTEAYVTEVNAQGLCGARDWRMPNRQELQSIVHYGRSISPRIDINYFPDTYAYSIYWTSSPSAWFYYAWIVDFGYGDVSRNRLYDKGSVRLVRSGK